MDVFIMWAGERSHTVARELKEFLQFVVRGPRYFISDDIESGRLWRVAIAGQLEAASFGIACLTPDNLRSHWLHFEAGALSKAVGQANVIPYLVGPEPTDVEGPLADFQMLVADEAGTRKLVMLLAGRVPEIPVSVVEKSFRLVWEEFEKVLTAARAQSATESEEPLRSQAAMLQELLNRVRRMDARSEPPAGRVVLPKAPLNLDAEMLNPMKARVLALIDSIEPNTTQTSMDTAIEAWRVQLKKPTLTAEELLDIYQSARHLDDYLNR